MATKPEADAKILPTIQPRKEAVYIYKKEKLRKSGFLPSLLSRFGMGELGGAAGSAGSVGSAAGAGGSFLGTVFSEGLLAGLVSSKAVFFATVMGSITAVVGLGILADQLRNPSAGGGNDKLPIVFDANANTRKNLKAGGAQSAQDATTPGGVTSLDYVVGAGGDAKPTQDDSASQSPGKTADAPAATANRPAPLAAKAPTPADAPAKHAQITAMKGNVNPTLSQSVGDGSSAAHNSYLSPKTKQAQLPGANSGAVTAMKPAVGKGTLHAGNGDPNGAGGPMGQLYNARKDNLQALGSASQGTSQAAGAAYDGSTQGAMMGEPNGAPTANNDNLNPQDPSLTPPTPPPPDVPPGQNESPWQYALMAAMGALALAQALAAFAKSNPTNPASAQAQAGSNEALSASNAAQAQVNASGGTLVGPQGTGLNAGAGNIPGGTSMNLPLTTPK